MVTIPRYGLSNISDNAGKKSDHWGAAPPSAAPPRNAVPAPYSTKPPAKAGYGGQECPQHVVCGGERGRDHEQMSAHKPEGSSSTSDVTDQTTTSEEIAPGDIPVSANSSAWIGESGARSSQQVET
ncbi:hypothetical protein GCM10022402_17710 [Salinactinospora qingdaonensis]|uniref:Uncharacterized protein n=1 Tax=Salinactinospora qingdaonensis TaxID=702744 RepID=A0ABP7FFC9_9ACTN